MKRSPQEIQLSSRRISRRAVLLGSVQMGIVGVLGYRMRQLQIEESQTFRMLADENRINERLIPPTRGLIYDRKGRAAAINIPNYRLTMTRDQAGDVENVLDSLQKLIWIEPEQLIKTRDELRRRSPFVPVVVAENLTWEDFSKVAANAPVLPGITTEVGFNRRYPMGKNLAHVVGYVGPVSDFDLKRIAETDPDPDPLLHIPRYQIGKTGTEEKLEDMLRGTAGIQRSEVNAIGRVMRELDRTESVSGADIQLTIDTKLQNYVLARMNDVSASAVVMDTTSGDLLAVASTPAFDANLFVDGISSKDYNALRDNKFGPLRAKAVQGTYPPASTYKMITALAALEAGLITPGERVKCEGHIEVHFNKFHCWNRGGHGRVALQQALMQSCDVYFYELAQRLDNDQLVSMAKRFGLGVRHNVPLSAVQRGIAPDNDWKQKTKGERWLLGDTINASIGQGFVLTSPLQLAVMSARLATGKVINPRLVHSVDTVVQPSGVTGDLDINPEHLSLIQNAMYGVTNRRSGTAYSKRVIWDKYKMAGKTGTAQVVRIRDQQNRRNENRPWEQRDHALFVGYAPFDDPKYAVSVVVEHGGGGGSVAAPIARDIALFAQMNQVPPLGVYPKKERKTVGIEQSKIWGLLDQFDATETVDEV